MAKTWTWYERQGAYGFQRRVAQVKSWVPCEVGISDVLDATLVDGRHVHARGLYDTQAEAEAAMRAALTPPPVRAPERDEKGGA